MKNILQFIFSSSSNAFFSFSQITFHNTIFSVKKYFSRNYGKVSDMLRIICNCGNLWRFLLSTGYFITPSNVDLTSCKALGYLYLIGYHLFRGSLFAFLLWTLYRMSSKKKDLWIGVTCIIIQTSFVVSWQLVIHAKITTLTHFVLLS